MTVSLNPSPNTVHRLFGDRRRAGKAPMALREWAASGAAAVEAERGRSAAVPEFAPRALCRFAFAGAPPDGWDAEKVTRRWRSGRQLRDS